MKIKSTGNIQKPTLIINSGICRENIRKMLIKAEKSASVFRPHFKTHQSVEVAEIFRQEGVDKITVSSVSMAEKFADAGWKDIFIAFPFNPREINEINLLAQKIKLSLLASCYDSALILSEKVKQNVDVYFKIDIGSHRTGFDPQNQKMINEAIAFIDKNNKLTFRGFAAHAGHTYHANSIDEIKKIYYKSIETLNELKHAVGLPPKNVLISWGDTPTCSVIDIFSGVDELRPGNFVFYDLMQLELGVCGFDDIAMIVACPVVAKHPERNEIVIYGGAVHLSKESLQTNEGKTNFGMLVNIDSNGKWSIPKEAHYVSRLSQEHGVISVSDNVMKNTKIGDLLGIIPVHACLAADLIKDHYII